MLRSRLAVFPTSWRGRACGFVIPVGVQDLAARVSEHWPAEERVGYVVAAAELLMQYGWDLVNVAECGGSNVACAFMRPRPPG